MSEDLIHCIYASSAAPGFADSDIPGLLEAARRKNASLNVTGTLLYIDGSFFQVLEGEAGTVDALYATIGHDPRHRRVTQIIREPIARRSFAQWTMGFDSLNGVDAAALLGENDFFRDATFLERLDAGRAKKLLRAFREGRWRADVTGVHRASPRAS